MNPTSPNAAKGGSLGVGVALTLGYYQLQGSKSWSALYQLLMTQLSLKPMKARKNACWMVRIYGNAYHVSRCRSSRSFSLWPVLGTIRVLAKFDQCEKRR